MPKTILFCKLLPFLAVIAGTFVTHYSLWYTMLGKDGLDMSNDTVGSYTCKQSNSISGWFER